MNYKHRADFAGFLIVLAVLLGIRVWNIHPLYLRPDTRATVEATLKEVAEREGWLLSALSVGWVNDTQAAITYRPHRRGSDGFGACFLLTLATRTLEPCGN